MRRGRPKPRSVKLSPLRTSRPAPSPATQRDPARVDASGEHQTLDQVAHLVVDQGGDDRRPEPEAAGQAAGHVVLTAALPDPELPRRADPALAGIQAQHHLAQGDRVVGALLGSAELEGH